MDCQFGYIMDLPFALARSLLSLRVFICACAFLFALARFYLRLRVFAFAFAIAVTLSATVGNSNYRPLKQTVIRKIII